MKNFTLGILFTLLVAACWDASQGDTVEAVYPLPPNYDTDLCARISYDLAFRAQVTFTVLDSTMRAVGCAQDEGGVYVAAN